MMNFMLFHGVFVCEDKILMNVILPRQITKSFLVFAKKIGVEKLLNTLLIINNFIS